MLVSGALRALVVFLFTCVFGCSTSPSTQPGVVLAEDAAVDVGDDSALAPFPVRRLPCASRDMLANDLPAEAYGSLEAELVSIVPPGTRDCPSDPDHLHLQVVVGPKRYDVAVTIDSDIGAPIAVHVHKLPPATVPEFGWSDAMLDYEALGTPSADYQALAPDALLARLQAELASAARVRIHGRSYADGTGVHNVHRNGRGRDGGVVIHRVEPDGGDRVIALRFASDVF